MDLRLRSTRRAVTSVAVACAVALAAGARADAAAPPGAVAWPEPTPARLADATGVLGTNLSGLAPADVDRLWAVRDAPGALLALDLGGDVWTPRAGWGSGRALRYPDGHAGPDAEAVATVATDPGAVYVGAERDNAEPTQRRNSVLRVETAGTGPLQATTEWRLDDLLPAVAANTGIEGLAWIPDDVLVRAGLVDRTGARYAPAAQPPHRGGVFVVAMEQRADLALVLLADDGRASLVATVASGLASTMDLHWDDAHQELWAVCDDTCDGAASVLVPRDGSFAVAGIVRPPAGLAARNDEGFALLPCRGTTTRAVWADDLATGGHALADVVTACAPMAPRLAATGAATSTTTTVAPAGTAAAGSGDGDGGAGTGAPVVAVIVIVVLVAAGAATVFARRRRR